MLQLAVLCEKLFTFVMLTQTNELMVLCQSANPLKLTLTACARFFTACPYAELRETHGFY